MLFRSDYVGVEAGDEIVDGAATLRIAARGDDAISRDERRAAFKVLQVPAAVSLSDATRIRIGELARASQLVVGRFRVEGDVLVVEASLLEIEAARIRAEASERGPVSDLFQVYERLANKWLAWNQSMLPEVDESSTGGNTGNTWADHIGARPATQKADNPGPPPRD